MSNCSRIGSIGGTPQYRARFNWRGCSLLSSFASANERPFAELHFFSMGVDFAVVIMI